MQRSLTFLFSVLFLLCLVSCKHKEPAAEILADAADRDISFSLQLPETEAAAIGTYALTENLENSIKTIDVLAFKQDEATGNEVFAYRVQGTQLVQGAAAAQASFLIRLKKTDQPYRFVVLANCRQQLENFDAASHAGQEKNELLATLTYAANGKWNTTSAADFQPLPMWGESTLIKIDMNTSSMPVISMLRSVAAIDISMSAAAQASFTLQSVRLYNSPAAGMIVPLPANLNTEKTKVTQPSLPAGAALNSTPAMFDVAAPATGLTRSIYLFEAAAKPVSTAGATCLVIGGSYNGGATSYYRVDLVSGSNPVPVLRNYKYTVNIKSVSSMGMSTAEQAYNSGIAAYFPTLLSWSDLSVKSASFDGQYALSTDKSSVVLWREKNAGVTDTLIRVSTNYPSGWTAAADQSWLTLNAASGGVNNEFLLGFSMTGPNKTGVTRTATITVTAGKIIKKVTVTDLPYYVYPKDQNNYFNDVDVNWSRYANVAENTNFSDDPANHQVSPARECSCAANGTGWRLPSITNLQEIYLYQNQIQGFAIIATDTRRFWYRTATSAQTTTSAYLINGQPAEVKYTMSFEDGKAVGNDNTGINWTFKARCIKSK